MSLPTLASAGDADRILLVDDDPANLDILRQALDGRGYKLLVATSGEDALRVALRARPSLVLLDVLMPGMDGFEVCHRLKGDPATADAVVIFLSALEDAREKVRGLEAGAVDFVTKPFQPEEVVARVHTHLTLQRLQRQLALQNAELQRELAVAQELLAAARRRVDGPLVGESAGVRALRDSIASHAATVDPLVLTGPHGAGQEAVARAIHHASSRSRQPFIHVNCALLAAGQASSLFAAVGEPEAGGLHLSQLDLAERGTLFLEEIHRMPAALQERLGAVLEAATRHRETGEHASADVRIVASTSALLSAEAGFQPALLGLLAPRQLRVPALAERAEDIPALARFFVDQHARRLGAVVERISDESSKRMQAYRWPGNVRELESVLERAVVSAREPVLEVDKALLDEGLPLGHYRLVSKLGEGGMGEVWRARHQLLARPCAVKLIKPDHLGGASGDAAVERFRLEARAISRLTSPNTVRLYDFGVSETGALYFVMELLDGLDLFSLVQRFGPMPAARIVPLLRQVCRSLAEAHEARLLHRDIKPQNLFLCRLGVDFDVVKVLDFGLVKSVGEDDAHLTADGVLHGTPAFMPPERATNGPVGETSDLYSLGCVAFWLLTGKPVFSGDPVAMLLHHVRTPAPRPSDVLGAPVPEPLERLVLDCLAKEPSRRPASALALDRRLAEIERADPWSPEQAEQWWRENLPELSTPAPGGDRSDDFLSQQTIA